MQNVGRCVLLAAMLLTSCGQAGAPAAQQSASSSRLQSPAASSARLESPGASSARLQSPPVGSPTPGSADPLLLSNTSGSFAFRHPASWQFINCENYSYAMWFGSAEGVGCVGESSGYFAMSVDSVAGDHRSAPAQGNNIYVGTVDLVTPVQVDGVDGTRTSAHIDSNPGMGPEAGTTQILYDVYNGTRTYLVLYQHRPSESDYSPAFDDLMQHSFRFSAWNAYHSSISGYTIDYPAAWYDLGNLGAPDTERYFANDKTIGSPIGMDSQGVMLALSTETGSCRVPPPGTVDDTAQLTVDSQTVTRISGFLGPPQSEVYWGSYASVPKGTNCFGFAFIFGSKSARDANLRITDLIISSFTTS
jgi:hypothetical protein